MQISENISSTEGEIEAVEKLSSVGKKINLFTSEKNKKDMYGERSAMSERYQLCLFLLKTVDQMFIGKEVRTKKFTNSVVLSFESI